MPFINRVLFCIGFPIAFIFLIPILFIWFPLSGIFSAFFWMASGKKTNGLYEKPVDWCFDFPFRISKYFEFNDSP